MKIDYGALTLTFLALVLGVIIGFTYCNHAPAPNPGTCYFELCQGETGTCTAVPVANITTADPIAKSQCQILMEYCTSNFYGKFPFDCKWSETSFTCECTFANRSPQS